MSLPALPDPQEVGLEEVPVFMGESWEDHTTAFLEVQVNINRDLWKLASVCASIESRYGDASFEKFGSEVGYSGQRVRDLAKTYKLFAKVGLNPRMSFHHHTIALKSVKNRKALRNGSVPREDAERAKAWLDRAEYNQLSTRQLDEEITQEITGSPPKQRRKCRCCGGSGWEEVD